MENLVLTKTKNIYMRIWVYINFLFRKPYLNDTWPSDFQSILKLEFTYIVNILSMFISMILNVKSKRYLKLSISGILYQCFYFI